MTKAVSLVGGRHGKGMVSLCFCLNSFFWVECRSALVNGVGRTGDEATGG